MSNDICSKCGCEFTDGIEYCRCIPDIDNYDKMKDDWSLIETEDIAAPYILKKNKPEPTKKEKDWSLKGKEIDTWRSGKKRGRHWNVYHEDVIDCLHKKLIEDIKSYDEGDICHCINQPISHIIWLINNRFGVK